MNQAIAELFADFSRSRLKEWLLDGKVQVNGEVVTKPRTKVMGGEEITLRSEQTDVPNRPSPRLIAPHRHGL